MQRRGYIVHPSWRHSFAQFLADMKPKPSAQHRLTRIDVNAGFELDNCKWETRTARRHI
jgi:hypothetical protein